MNHELKNNELYILARSEVISVDRTPTGIRVIETNPERITQPQCYTIACNPETKTYLVGSLPSEGRASGVKVGVPTEGRSYLGIASRIWCDPEMKNLVMDEKLCKKIAELLFEAYA